MMGNTSKKAERVYVREATPLSPIGTAEASTGPVPFPGIFARLVVAVLVLYAVNMGVVMQYGAVAVEILGGSALAQSTTADVAAEFLPEVRGAAEDYQRHRMQIVIAITVAHGLFLVIVAAFLYRLFRKVERVRTVARRIADGRMNRLVDRDTEEIFGGLGATVNDIAMNLQEALLSVWTCCQESAAALNDIEEKVIRRSHGECPDAEIQDDMRRIRRDLMSMKFLVQEFQLFNVQFETGTIPRQQVTTSIDDQRSQP